MPRPGERCKKTLLRKAEAGETFTGGCFQIECAQLETGRCGWAEIKRVMDIIRVNLRALSIVLAMLLAAPLWAAEAQAATQRPSAHQVVEKTTQRVMTIIAEAQGYYDKDPERFYREIEKVLDDVVDFDSFAPSSSRISR